MNLTTRIKSLEATLKRLEAATGKGQRNCAYCRLCLRPSWPDPNKPKPRPEDLVKGKCQFCHSDYCVDLTGIPDEVHDEYQILYTYTIEDIYTDPKINAFTIWLCFRPKVKKEFQEDQIIARRKDSKSKDVIARAKLVEEVNRLFEERHKRLRAKYGIAPYLEHFQIIESIQNRERHRRKPDVYVGGLFDLEEEETSHQICAALEKIIWGGVRPSTTSAIERIEREIDELIRTTEEAEKLRKDEAIRREREFLNIKRASIGLPPLPEE